MITQLRIGLRLHRFEVIAAVIATGILAASAIIVRTRLDAIGVPMSCWDAWFGRSAELAVPAAVQRRRPAVPLDQRERGRQGRRLDRPPATRRRALPWRAAHRSRDRGWHGADGLDARGVARPLVRRSASAVAHRPRGDARRPRHRVRHPWSGREPWYPALRFGDAGLHGPVVVGKGLAAFGMAVLLGAIFGRVLPAIIVGAVLCVALFVGWGFGYQWWTTAEAANHPSRSQPQQEVEISRSSSRDLATSRSASSCRRPVLYLGGRVAGAGRRRGPYRWVETPSTGRRGRARGRCTDLVAIETSTFALIGIGALLVVARSPSSRRAPADVGEGSNEVKTRPTRHLVSTSAPQSAATMAT